MNRSSLTPQTRQHHGVRSIESEGILRMLLLAFAVAMPLASMVYLSLQNTRLSYEMSQVKEQIQKAQEDQRKLMLERSRFQRDEEIQGFANQVGLQPRKQSFLILRRFTAQDQKLAKLRPVASDEFTLPLSR